MRKKSSLRDLWSSGI